MSLCLDVRASDLLQANGLIWVEGPSDRTYINKWIELSSTGKLKEGIHYQIVFYGGRLLSHLTAEPERDDLVNIFSVNRNAIVVMDSDKKSHGDPINATKTRIKTEIERVGGIVWITDGREVENYLPVAEL
jgi:putative ATP-dependent endonuclease of the OLD family